jgi:hypothetical protein
MLNLAPLLAKAFFRADARNANEAIPVARAMFAAVPEAKSFSYEVVAPERPDTAWLEKKLLPRLVYHCESTRSPLPACAGVFCSLFVGEELYFIAAADVVAFGGAAFGAGPEELVRRFGTGESVAPLKPPAGLLGSEPGD